MPSSKGKETQPFDLIETKRTQGEVEWIRIKLGFDNLFVVDPLRRCGGLALF
jgi:hypothetical protein